MRWAVATIEARMAARFCDRPDGWPVGPERLTGPGWSSPSPSVQLIERVGSSGGHFTVLTLFPFRRIDLRHSEHSFSSRTRPLAYAWACLRSGGRPRPFSAPQPVRPRPMRRVHRPGSAPSGRGAQAVNAAQLDAALAYAEQGWPVLQLVAAGAIHAGRHMGDDRRRLCGHGADRDVPGSGSQAKGSRCRVPKISIRRRWACSC